MSTEHSFILKLSCADRPGIVHAVSGFLFERGSNILDSAQFGDSRTGEFFMRVHFQQVGGDPGLDALRDGVRDARRRSSACAGSCTTRT